MDIPLYVHGNMYDEVTIDAWQTVWDQICKMAYDGTNICETIITRPGLMHMDGEMIYNSNHSDEYKKLKYVNSDFLTLDNIWKQYSHLYGTAEVKIIPEFKKLVVPRSLYECLGVKSWFRYSFPNCHVVFWDE